MGLEMDRVQRERLALDARGVGEGHLERLARPGPVLRLEHPFDDPTDRRQPLAPTRPHRAALQAPHLRPRASLRGLEPDPAACSSVDCQLVSTSSRPRLTAASPSSTTSWPAWAPLPEEVAPAPPPVSREGSPVAPGLAPSTSRRTRECASPRARGRSDPRPGRRSPGPARRRESRIEASGGPSLRRPLTSQPGASAPGPSRRVGELEGEAVPGGQGTRGHHAVHARGEPHVEKAVGQVGDPDGGRSVDAHVGRRPARQRARERPSCHRQPRGPRRSPRAGAG